MVVFLIDLSLLHLLFVLVAILIGAITIPLILLLIKQRAKKATSRDFGLYTLIPSEVQITDEHLGLKKATSNIQSDPTHPQRLSASDNSIIPGLSNATSQQLEISDEFQLALEAMENTSKCIFVTGEAGTGKSTLLRYFVKTTKKKIVVLAPTGVAAMNVGGQTIHSFFKFPPRPITANDIKVSSQGELCKVLDAIIIDEISMVRADLLDGIDKFLRLNGRDFTKPFGGTQLIFFGDLFQLPPIVSDSTAGQFFAQYYKSPFFFDAHVFNEINIHVIKLRRVYRQRDPRFVAILNRIRTGHYLETDLHTINERYNNLFEASHGDGYITLTSTNKLADAKNRLELEKLPTKEYTFVGTVEGSFDPKSYPTDLVLRLKVGAQVMFVKNDVGRRWVNGTVGIVEELNESKICVRIPTPPNEPPLIHEVRPEMWEVISYKLNHVTRSIDSEVVGRFTQYPLRLAWAITIHKSQGKTFDKVVIDLGSGAFAHGQAYVALSRCSSLDTLILKQKLRRQDIIVDSKVFRFLDRLSVYTE